MKIIFFSPSSSSVKVHTARRRIVELCDDVHKLSIYKCRIKNYYIQLKTGVVAGLSKCGLLQLLLEGGEGAACHGGGWQTIPDPDSIWEE